jgi:PIN domain nuclease of toxin-antitoxin system
MVSDERQLSDYAKDLLFESGATKLLSPASYWEIAIKIKIGKLSLRPGFDEFIGNAIDDYDLEILNILPKHTSVLTSLQMFHGDPFDRLLVAQASIEEIPILSKDKQLDPYPVCRLWRYEEETPDEQEEMTN